MSPIPSWYGSAKSRQAGCARRAGWSYFTVSLVHSGCWRKNTIVEVESGARQKPR